MKRFPDLIKAGRIDAGKRVDHARREINWLAENWFARPSYLKLGGRPVLLSFGQTGLSDPEWQDVVAKGPVKFVYLSEHERRNAAAGAFDWPSPRIGPSAQDDFYRKAARWPVGMAVAYPRFHDIYEQAKVHPSWGNIADDEGKTFALTLTKALKSGLPVVQISTWNDWGEGTIIEPSTEFGYRDLEVVQHGAGSLSIRVLPVRPKNLDSRIGSTLCEKPSKASRSWPASSTGSRSYYAIERSTSQVSHSIQSKSGPGKPVDPGPVRALPWHVMT